MGVNTAGLTADLTTVFEDIDPVKTAAGAAASVAQAVHDNTNASPDHTDTIAPTVNDDVTLGYIVGSRWVIIGSDEYVCLDNTDGAAVWRNTTAGGASLSSNIPAALGVAAAGVGVAASRDDHVHAMPSAADVSAVPTGRTLTGTAPVKIAGGSSADLSADRTISVDVMVGDSGAGGSAGLVPAPAIGDAAKFLRGDGTFATPTGGSGDVTGGASATVGAPAVYTNADGKQIGQLIGEGVLGLVSGVLTKITTALGDLVYGGASGTPTRLAGNTTTTQKVLAQTGDGAASAAPVWTAVSGLTVGDASNPGVLKLGAPGGARAYTATTQTLSADGTLTADVEQLRVTAACAVTLPAISTLTIARPTMIVIESTSEIIVELVPNAADKIEGSARAALVATRGVYLLTPGVATKWTLTALRGLAQWLHATVDLTAASGASPWTIGSVVVTDISTASSNFAATSGLVATAKSSSTFTSSASADCALACTPLTGLVDGWSRPLHAERDAFWILAQQSRTTGTGTTNVIVGLGGAAVSNVPRIAANNSVQNSDLEIAVRDSAARSLATTTASTTAAGWLGYLWDGPARRLGDLLCSTSPSGSPGAASGWWPRSHATAQRYAAGQDFFGAIWDLAALTNVQIGQSNQTTGTKYTFTALAFVRQIGVPG